MPGDSTVLRQTAAFLAEYASLLLGCGGTCIRIEKNTKRMAEAFGVNLDIFIMPDHVTVRRLYRREISVADILLRNVINILESDSVQALRNEAYTAAVKRSIDKFQFRMAGAGLRSDAICRSISMNSSTWSICSTNTLSS